MRWNLSTLALAAILAGMGLATQAGAGEQKQEKASEEMSDTEKAAHKPIGETIEDIDQSMKPDQDKQETAVPESSAEQEAVLPERQEEDQAPGGGQTNEQGEVIGPIDGESQQSDVGNEADDDTAEAVVPGTDTMTVKGTVTSVEKDTGYFNVDTTEGKSMRLHADPTMLQGMNLEKGNKVTARYEKRGEMNHVTVLEPMSGEPKKK